jgi:site-specific DNA-methyltransferase (adenine-specific)
MIQQSISEETAGESYFPYGRGSTNDNIATPLDLIKELDEEFHFNFDPNPINPEGLRDVDGLGDWKERNFCNPPYSNKEPWIKKAIEEQKKGHLTVMLLPVDTSTRWFHNLILPNAEIRWIRGRLKFSKGIPAPFASMICIFRPRKDSGSK